MRARAVIFGTVLTLLAGCGGTAPAHSQAANDLRILGLLYHTYYNENKKPPANIEDLQSLATKDKDSEQAYKRLKNGDYIMAWKVDLGALSKKEPGAVLAYEKNVRANGGPVLLVDGTVKNMTAQDFEKASKAA